MVAAEVGEEDPRPVAKGWREKLTEQWQKTKEHAETYPYVWASYIVVYGGLAVYTTYRYMKLRRTEDRVRVLQERLRKLVEAEEAAAAGGSTSSSSSGSVAQKSVEVSANK